LKNSVDDFKMYPSRRVWHSIYNNMHPGSRWPSVSMCITLLCTLFLIGYLNTNHTSTANKPVAATKNSNHTVAAVITNGGLINNHNNIAFNNTATKTPAAATANSLAKNNKNALYNTTGSHKNRQFAHSIFSSKNKLVSITSAQSATATQPINADTKASHTTADVINSSAIATSSNNTDDISIAGLQAADAQKIAFTPATATLPGIETLQSMGKNPSINPAAATLAAQLAAQNSTTETDRSWIEHDILYNRPAPKKWKGRLALQGYITPSLVYRNLVNNAANKNIGNSGIANSINNSDLDNSVLHTPSFGVEAGASFVYDLVKKIRIKAGVQLNFARYSLHAFDNYHPFTTSITLNDANSYMAYEAYRSSPYSNGYGIQPVKLHNQTLQLSLPVGADYRLASVDNIDWYAGATIQPTLILGAQSYLLSTDRRNYIKEADMTNRFNLNAGFETFLSMKTKKGYTWQIGPQFRKQLFSTNSRLYSVEERIVNYGIKLGVTKKL
ncbi:MAG: hypothetical protein RL172_3280, partial [Bacteroidota bacterium]